MTRIEEITLRSLQSIMDALVYSRDVPKPLGRALTENSADIEILFVQEEAGRRAIVEMAEEQERDYHEGPVR